MAATKINVILLIHTTNDKVVGGRSYENLYENFQVYVIYCHPYEDNIPEKNSTNLEDPWEYVWLRAKYCKQ